MENSRRDTSIAEILRMSVFVSDLVCIMVTDISPCSVSTTYRHQHACIITYYAIRKYRHMAKETRGLALTR